MHYALLEVLLSPFRAFILGGTEISLIGGSTLEANSDQIELLVHVAGILLVILIPLYKELLLEVQYGVGQ